MKKSALIISCFDWYKNRLEPIREILEKEYNVTILLSDYDHIRKITQTERYSVCTYLHVPPYHKNISIGRIWSHFCFGQAVKRQLRRLQVDLIYLVLPPNYTAYHCMYYKYAHPLVKYYVDLIDLWPESLPIDGFQETFLAKFWAGFRNSSIKIADHVFIECDLYRRKVENIIKDSKRITSLYLFKEQSQDEYDLVLRKIEESKEKEENYISIAYLGSINNIIDIDSIRKIIRILIKKRYTVEIRIIGNGESLEEFLHKLKAEGADVNYCGEIYNEVKKIELLCGCDYALNIMKYSVNVGLTIKSIDYLSMGIPILNNIHGDTWDFVEKEGIGINIDEDYQLLEEKMSRKIDRRKVLNYFRTHFLKDKFIEKVSEILI